MPYSGNQLEDSQDAEKANGREHAAIRHKRHRHNDEVEDIPRIHAEPSVVNDDLECQLYRKDDKAQTIDSIEEFAAGVSRPNRGLNAKHQGIEADDTQNAKLEPLVFNKFSQGLHLTIR